MLVSGSYNSTIQVQEAAIGKVLYKLKGHSSGIKAIIFLLNSKKLATRSNNETIQIQDIAKDKVIEVLKASILNKGAANILQQLLT